MCTFISNTSFFNISEGTVVHCRLKFGTFDHTELCLDLKNYKAMAGFEPVSLDVSTNEIGQIFRLKYVSLNLNNFFSWQLF